MPRAMYRKVITSPEVMGQVNPENIKLCNIFLKDKARKCSNETLKQYKSALDIFMCWNVLEGNNEFYPLIKKIEISSFFDYICEELKVNGKRFGFFKSVLSGLSDCVIKYYDEDERCKTFRNFIGAIIENVPKTEVREKTILNEEQVKFLLDVLIEQERYQEACLVSLAANSGMRISELVQMKKSWIDLENVAYDGLFFKTPEMRTKGSGKTGKVISRLILKDPFVPYYNLWITQREQILKDKNILDHDMLFINTNGLPASQEVIRGFVAKWEKILNINMYAHCFRHYFTTLMKSKYKASDEFIRTIIRWSSNDLVQLYNDQKEDEIEWEEIGNIKAILSENNNV